ncbi:MAG: FHA domain-containing protein [Acidimicrobiales bacterium]
MATCSNGHESEWPDFCSSCGVAMAGTADPATADAPASVDSGVAPDPVAPSGLSCPNCAESYGDSDVFCENCGYDFLSGSMPGALPEPDPTVAGPEAAMAVAEAEADWKLVGSVDRAYFDRMSAEGQLDFPDPVPADTEVALIGEKVLVGRRSESRGVFPEIDVSALTGDPAASTRHAMLERQTDGSYTVTDLDSTNGTFLGDSDDAMAPGSPVQLANGDVVHLGAWTKLEIQQA